MRCKINSITHINMINRLCTRHKYNHYSHPWLLVYNVLVNVNAICTCMWTEAGIAQWLEHRTRDRKVAGSNPCWSGGRIFLLQGQLSVLTLISVSVPPRVTTVARKRPRSCCQKRRWQVTAKPWHLTHEVTWCMVVWCTQNAPERASAVSCGTSHASAVSTSLRWIFKNRAIKKAIM